MAKKSCKTCKRWVKIPNVGTKGLCKGTNMYTLPNAGSQCAIYIRK